MQEYLAQANVSPLLTMVGFDISRVYFDALHTFELGIYQVVLPSILAELTGPGSTVFPGATLPLRLKKATQVYHAWARRNRVLAVVKRITAAWVELPFPRISRLLSWIPRQHARARAGRGRGGGGVPQQGRSGGGGGVELEVQGRGGGGGSSRGRRVRGEGG